MHRCSSGRRRHRDGAWRLQRGAIGAAEQWPRETRTYVARILRRFGGPATLEDTPPATLVAAGASPAGGRMEVRLLP